MRTEVVHHYDLFRLEHSRGQNFLDVVGLENTTLVVAPSKVIAAPIPPSESEATSVVFLARAVGRHASVGPLAFLWALARSSGAPPSKCASHTLVHEEEPLRVCF